MADLFEAILDEFKSKEAPETVLVVGDDANVIKVILAWPNLRITRCELPPVGKEDWDDLAKWDWLWSCVDYQRGDLAKAVGIPYQLDKILAILIANRILYPDGSVHSYVMKFLRDRVVKLFETKPRSRARTSTK